ncbi:hypothetical protein [Paenibacillus elgii]|uniref:hypothetical protein n=1 Tax=Paenibacillus elgii TaxID=189691 RepID=UPI0030DC3F3B
MTRLQICLPAGPEVRFRTGTWEERSRCSVTVHYRKRVRLGRPNSSAAAWETGRSGSIRTTSGGSCCD